MEYATGKELWGNERRLGVPISVVVFATSPVKLLTLWASLKRQTYRNFEIVLVNQARDSKSADAIRALYDSVISKEHFGETVHLRRFRRFCGVWRAKYKTIMLCDQDSQFEPGHIESLLRTEMRTGKRAVASYCVLGEYGGFDTAALRINKATSKQDNFRLGMFLMNTTEITSICREMRAVYGMRYHLRLDAEFLKRYWRKYMRKKSVGTLLPTQIVGYAKSLDIVR